MLPGPRDLALLELNLMESVFEELSRTESNDYRMNVQSDNGK